MITGFDSLDIVPVQEFFAIEHFYSRLQDSLISEEEYENLGELNKLYNFQDTIILCEIFDSRATYLKKNL